MARQIAHSFTRQRLSRRIPRRIAARMAADCSYLRSSTAFTTVCAPYCSADGSGLLILPLVKGFHDGLRAVLPHGWQRIAHSCTRQRLSRWFARRTSPQMAADCAFFLSSTAFTTVCAPYCSADGSALLILPLVNGFPDGFRAVLLSGWQRIAHTSARQQLSRRFARRIAQRMEAHCSFFLPSTAFTTVCAPYCSADGSGLLILPLVTGFPDGLSAVFLRGWQRIAHSSTRQWFSQRIVHRIAQRMARRIAHSFSRQRLSRRFARRIAQRMAADCSYLRSSTAFPTVRAPYCSADGGGSLILPLVNGFSDGLRAVLLSGRQRIAHSSARQRLSRRFARRIAQRIAADCSYLRSSTAFTTVCSPYCSAAGTITHSWVHSFLPLVDDFANVAPAVDCSPYRSFFRLSTSYATFCVLYCSTDGATA